MLIPPQSRSIPLPNFFFNEYLMIIITYRYVAAASLLGSDHGSEVGRRATAGRRGGEMAPSTPSTSYKPQRDSPPSDRSPTSETEKMTALEIVRNSFFIPN